ncbi:MAG: flagellar export protein FliJ [Candidatus Zixiibacteriota bacterium]
MKPFHFRLQRLLRLKVAEKGQCALALGRSRHELGMREDELRAAEDRHGSMTESYLRLADKPSCPSDWILGRNALDAAHRRVQERQTAVQQAATRVEEARLRLVEQSREVEAYQRLRRKAWEEHNREVQRTVQKDIDATAGEKFTRSAAPRG